MKLYTERHGIRAPRKKTYSIDRDMYLLLLYCCKRYKKLNTYFCARFGDCFKFCANVKN